METIKTYLENMFSGLPDTPEVRKARYELEQMMEDKYSELKSSGKSENEAIGIVISEFGNLDELAESLGLQFYINRKNESNTIQTDAKILSMEDAFAYLKTNTRHACLMALGVLFCIISPVGAVLTSDITFGNIPTALFETSGVCFLFVAIAIAVGLFVYSSMSMSKWDWLKKESCMLDTNAASEINRLQESSRKKITLSLVLGIGFCILCVLPPIIIDSLDTTSHLSENLGAALLLIFVAIGVFLIVQSSIAQEGFRTLLKLSVCDAGEIFKIESKEPQYKNPTVASIMSVYWPTITCLYFCWSFLTFQWNISWIIWPVASIIEKIINNLFKE